MTAPPKKILIIRNDKLGDFMLAWPAISLLKKQYPDCEVTALVPEYTAAMAERCEWIDRILIDDRRSSTIKDIMSLSENISKQQFDASISLYSEARTAIALWLAGVKRRVGPATKMAQFFLNNRLRQKRSRSSKPEYEYNIDLVRHYIKLCGDDCKETVTPPYLKFDRQQIHSLKNEYLQRNDIPGSTKLILIHPGTGGSAINLSLQQYAELAHNIAKRAEVFFIITAGPGELDIAEKLSALLTGLKHDIHQSTGGIVEFCKFINIGDLFISGSTGPLHIAGALDVNTAAFYPARKSATALRWQTTNSADKRLTFSPEKYTGESDMQQIDMIKSADNIVEMFLT